MLPSFLKQKHVCTFSCIGDDRNEGEFHKSFCSDKIPVLENVSVSIQLIEPTMDLPKLHKSDPNYG